MGDLREGWWETGVGVGCRRRRFAAGKALRDRPGVYRRCRPRSTCLMSYIRYDSTAAGAPFALPLPPLSMAAASPTTADPAGLEASPATPAFSPLYQQIKDLIL